MHLNSGGDSPIPFSKRKLNPVPGWFPHHWHYLSHWQWIRLPSPPKSSLKEGTLQLCLVNKLLHPLLHIHSTLVLSFPLKMSQFSTHWSPRILILPISLLPSKLIAQPFSVPHFQTLCYAFPILPYFPPFLSLISHHPIHLPLFLFPFRSGSNISAAWAQQDLGTRWGQALWSQGSATARMVLNLPALIMFCADTPFGVQI